MNLSKLLGGLKMMELFNEDHLKNLPTIRLTGITLDNFKNVKHGEILLNCGKKHIPYGTKADILGLYGQNGSGKTSLIEAISILKSVLSGTPVQDEYADCIDVSAEYSSLSFSFDLQYPEGNDYPTNGDVRKVVYTFKIAKDEKVETEEPHLFINEEVDELLPVSKYRVRVFDEVLKVSGTICGEKVTLKPFCDTSNPKSYIGPSTKAKYLVGTLDEDKRIKLGVNKNLAESKSKSFLFMIDSIRLFRENSDYSVFYQMLVELNLWARAYLFVVDSKSTGLVRLNFMLPVFEGGKTQLVPISKRFSTSEEAFEDMKAHFSSLSMVLTQIVPGLTVEVMDYGKTLLKDGSPGHSVELVAKRGDTVIPLRCESDGVRKLISTLNLLIRVYNQRSTTVAYDEFDAGVFEYLLGEILQVLQSSGKGQFIFTSHNMRPLEILKKDYIWFTTTDANNRYLKLSHIGESNNLRRVYYREIALHENYDNLYDETKQNKIVSAMRKAGGIYAKT